MMRVIEFQKNDVLKIAFEESNESLLMTIKYFIQAFLKYISNVLKVFLKNDNCFWYLALIFLRHFKIFPILKFRKNT
jgi:hypothetical protein